MIRMMVGNDGGMVGGGVMMVGNNGDSGNGGDGRWVTGVATSDAYLDK